MRMINLARTLAASVTLITAPLLFAHTDQYLDSQPTPHGGQVRTAGVYHFELVVAKDSLEAKTNPVVVYVTDHGGKPISTQGATATATLLAGTQKTTLNLTPKAENRLEGSGVYASSKDLKVVISLTLPGKPTEQARFTPLSPVTTAP